MASQPLLMASTHRGPNYRLSLELVWMPHPLSKFQRFSLSWYMIVFVFYSTRGSRIVRKIWACSLVLFKHVLVLMFVFRSTSLHAPLKYRCMFTMDNMNRRAYLTLKPWLQIHYNATSQRFQLPLPTKAQHLSHNRVIHHVKWSRWNHGLCPGTLSLRELT